MAKFRTVPDKNEIFAKHSSLSITLHEDDEHTFSFYIWNRRTRSIISRYDIPLLEHCRYSMQDVRPIKK